MITARLMNGQAVQVGIEHNIITAIKPIDTKEHLPYIGAGLCDLQINGYKGIDFNGNEPIVYEDLALFQDNYLKEGCTTFLPTIITNDPKNISSRLKEITELIEKYPKLESSILGFHVEGPFISPLDGARGAHAKEFVCEPNIEWVKEWQTISKGKIKILTLSPEWGNANKTIKEISSMGICVSIGHTMASSSQITEAVLHGAKMVTHFGNGVPIEIRRHPNFLWQELAEENLSLGLIADGFHLPDSVLKVVLSVKGKQCFLVSDSTIFGGQPAGIYKTHIGGDVKLTEDKRLCLLHDENLLAGSALSLRYGVEHLLNKSLATLENAWQLGSSIPATKINQNQHASLTVGSFANMVLCTYEHNTLNILETYLQGKKYN